MLTGYTPFRARDVRGGDSIARAVDELRKEEASYQVQRLGTVRKWQTPNGTVLYQDQPSQVYVHPWYPVLSSANSVALRKGLINTYQPTVNGVLLDGTQPDGSQGDPPQLLITGAPPANSLFTWVVVQVLVDPKSNKILDPATNPAAVTLQHVTTVDTVYRDGGSLALNTTGRQPVAIIIWAQDGQNILRVEPCTTFNLNHQFVPVGPNLRGRHLFWI